jgi:hypothetical protein
MHSNVRIRAYDLGNTDLATLRFGWHGMTMDLTTETQIQGVHMVDYGQQGLLGRYAWHFHTPSYNSDGTIKTGGIPGNTSFSQTADPLGPNYPADKAVFKNNAMDEGHNRAFVFHACRGVVAHDNIAYKSFGHSFFEEDGSEEDNESVRNLAIRAEAPGYTSGLALKIHEVSGNSRNFGAAGHWFGNLRNRHVDNWAADCEHHGWWNGTPVKNLSNTQACTGFSVNVPICPNSNPFNTDTWDEWNGNSALSCGQGGRTNMNPNSEQGGGADTGYLPTAEGTTSGTAIAATFKGIRFFKCGGVAVTGDVNRNPYHNRLNIGIYENARVADNYQATFNGQVGPGSFNRFAIGIGHSLNAQHIGHYTEYAASYHGLMHFDQNSYYDYTGDTVGGVGSGHYDVFGTGVLDTGDLYLQSISTWPADFADWRMHNSNGTFQSPGPCNTVNMSPEYDSLFTPPDPREDYEGLQHFRHNFGVLYDHFGRLAQGPTQRGIRGGHIVFNHPFFTHYLTDEVELEENPHSVVTATPFFGINMNAGTYHSPTPFSMTLAQSEKQIIRGIYKSTAWYLVDDSGVEISGRRWEVRDQWEYSTGTPSEGPLIPYPADGRDHALGYNNGSNAGYYPTLFSNSFNQANFVAVATGSVVVYDFLGTGDSANGKDVTDYAYVTQITGARAYYVSSATNPNASSADYMIIGIPVKGTRTVSGVNHGGVSYTALSSPSIANLRAASADKYWHDTANNRLYIKLGPRQNAPDNGDRFATWGFTSS